MTAILIFLAYLVIGVALCLYWEKKTEKETKKKDYKMNIPKDIEQTLDDFERRIS